MWARPCRLSEEHETHGVLSAHSHLLLTVFLQQTEKCKAVKAVYYQPFSLSFQFHICFSFTETTRETQDANVASLSGFDYTFDIFHHVIKLWESI